MMTIVMYDHKSKHRRRKGSHKLFVVTELGYVLALHDCANDDLLQFDDGVNLLARNN